MTSRSSKGAARRDEIVAMARFVLVEDGIEAFALRDIAGRLGITVGNLQYYFATRDDLLEVVITQEADRDLCAVEEALAGTAPITATELSKLAARLVGPWVSEGNSIFMLLGLLAFHQERFDRLNHQIYQRFWAAIGRVIARTDPTAKPAEVAMRARLVTAILDGMAIQLHAGAATGPKSAKQAKLVNAASRIVAAVAANGVSSLGE